MSKNIFEEHVRSIKRTNQENADSIALTKSMLRKISIEYGGTPLNYLLDPTEVKLSKDFIQAMKKHNFPLAVRAELEVKNNNRPLTTRELNHDLTRQYGKRRLVDRFRWKKLWSGKGYLVGSINLTNNSYRSSSQSVQVIICEDLKLRCKRTAPLFSEDSSLASGFGDIPSKKVIQYHFKTGRYVSDNSSGNIFTELGLKEVLLGISEKALSTQAIKNA